MRFKFFALVWNAANQGECSAAGLAIARLQSGQCDWERVCESPGLAVFCTGHRKGVNTPYMMTTRTGVVLGKLFDRRDESQPPRDVSLSACDTEAIIANDGRHLIESFWGRYVAFWRDSKGRKFVLRDPTGTFPCYEAQFQGVRLYFSWLQDCLDLQLVRFSVDWDYVSALLPMAIIHSRFTGLHEVTQLLQSECVCIDGPSATRQLLWEPSKFALVDEFEDKSKAVNILRDTVRRCVFAWASCYSGILLRMSGGLDSTIVLSCLRDAPGGPPFAGMIHYSLSPRGDERPFARIAADSARCRLIECERNTHVALDDLLRMHPLPEPHSCIPFTQNNRVESRIAAEVGADGIFSGGGGDQIFYQARTEFAASDYLHRHSFRPALLSIALSGARLEQVSVWRVIRLALADHYSKRRFDPLADVSKYWHLLSPEVLANARKHNRFDHPWAQHSAEIPIGKQWQIQGLKAPHTYYDPRGGEMDSEYVRPLASQPLLELSLQIPTYVLTNGGWDRALARHAFATDIPAKIATRRTKGAADVHIEKVLAHNLDFARTFLLDGLLVKNRLIDSKKLDDVLAGRMVCVDSPTVEIYHYLAVESWLRVWKANQQSDSIAA